MKIIWATRGKTWGYKFLLDGQFADPLPVYERAFSGAEDEPEVFRCIKGGVALRFPDPEGRQDSSGRVIPHEFVILGPLAERARSLEDGRRLVWPIVAEQYQVAWQMPKAPLVEV